jgi:uncharacterized protein (TIGR03086 family)
LIAGIGDAVLLLGMGDVMTGDDDLAQFLAAQRSFTERVHAIQAGQWGYGTPDAGWAVADLVGHLVEEHCWAEALLGGLSLDAAREAVDARYGPGAGDFVSAGLGAQWDEAAAASARAFRAAGALTGSVEITRGRSPAREYLAEITLDLVVHSWDLATAIGYPGPLPADVVEAVYAQAADIVARTPSGMFSGPVSVPAGAPVIDRLVALTGRDPR